MFYVKAIQSSKLHYDVFRRAWNVQITSTFEILIKKKTKIFFKINLSMQNAKSIMSDNFHMGQVIRSNDG